MGIPEAIRAVLDHYESLRGKKVEPGVFWDVIVVTAMDEEQKLAFSVQLEDKEKRGEVPLGIKYIALADPPGTRVGSGGATMHAISHLHELFGDDLWQMKVLLINAGGLSQRLPSASITGKIFTALPLEDSSGRGTDLLDYKLACFLPFLNRMKPGIFHAAADTIETFELGEGSNWDFYSSGFTAMAHPSSLDIGTTHGVFVLKENDTQSTGLTSLQQCIKVLQKPTLTQLRDSQAVVTLDGQEIVYTDSNFFFDHQVSKKFLQFYQKHGLSCEIDAYGDFLQGLGVEGTDEYVTDVRNVSRVEESLITTRSKIFQLLRDSPLQVLLMNHSKFYHLGTAPECLEHFCSDSSLKTELGFSNWVCSHWEGGKLKQEGKANQSKLKHSQGTGSGIGDRTSAVESHGWCCICSFISNGPAVIGEGSLIEFCRISGSVNINQGCFISHCVIESTNDTEITIPENTFMYTACIIVNSMPLYATMAMGVFDNVKKTYDDPTSVKWFGKPLGIIGKDMNEVKTGKTCYNLWHAKLFTVHKSPAVAFEETWKSVNALHTNTKVPPETSDMFSMADIINCKDIQQTLKFRNSFRSMIEKHVKLKANSNL